VSSSDAVTLESTVGHSEISWAEIEWAIKHESVQHLDDLMLRRTRLGNVMPNLDSQSWSKIKHLMMHHLGWSESVWHDELERYLKLWNENYSLPCKKGECSKDVFKASRVEVV